MSALLVDVVQVEAVHAVVLADGVYGLVDALLQLAVEHEEQACRGVVLLQVGEHLGKSRPEGVELQVGPVAVDILPYWRSAPAVVGSAADENDVGIAQVVAAIDEGAVGIVAELREAFYGHARPALVLGIAAAADGRAGEGVVALKPCSELLDDDGPPALLSRHDVVDLMMLRALSGIVPDGVGVGNETALEGGVAVAKDGDGKAVSPLPLGRESQSDGGREEEKKPHPSIA